MNIGIRLNKLKHNDFIWIIYFFIVIAALYANNLEKDYYSTNNISSHKKERIINITILTIAFFIYLYFVLTLTEDLSNMEKNFENTEYRETFAKLIGAILFLVAGAIYVIVEVISSVDDELAIIE